MRSALLVLGVVTTTFLSEPIEAQKVRLLVAPRAGVITPATSISQRFDQVPGFDATWRYDMKPAFSYGALVEVPTPLAGLGVRLEWTEGQKASITHADGTAGPPTYGDVSAKLRITSAAALIQPERLCLRNVCPRLVAGAGIKQYDFEGALLWDDVVDRFAKDQSVTTLQLGLGLITYLDRFAIIAEVNDFSNRVEFATPDNAANRVHDLVINLGAAIRF